MPRDSERGDRRFGERAAVGVVEVDDARRQGAGALGLAGDRDGLQRVARCGADEQAAVGEVVEGERRRRRRAREDPGAHQVAERRQGDRRRRRSDDGVDVLLDQRRRWRRGPSPGCRPRRTPSTISIVLAEHAAGGVDRVARRRATAWSAARPSVAAAARLRQQEPDPQDAVVDACRHGRGRRGRRGDGRRRSRRRRCTRDERRSGEPRPTGHSQRPPLHHDRAAAGALPCTDASDAHGCDRHRRP